MAKRPPLTYYIDGLKAGNRVVLSRAITLVESSLDSDRKLATKLIDMCLPLSGHAYRIGITGVPGVGKSTFIDALGSLLIQHGYRVAVLAIDPSSVKSRGSILGDKTRMSELAKNEFAYIRPSPTGGSLGGVARKTRESIILCEAAGYDMIIIETVGVGQSELMVHAMVDFFLLLMLPNAGDELQGIKKGIMEMADALIVNKADGDMLEKAKEAKRIYAQTMYLSGAKPSGWHAKILYCSALKKEGLNDIVEVLAAFKNMLKANQYWEKNRQDQTVYWMEATIKELLEAYFYDSKIVNENIRHLKKKVITQRLSPIHAAEILMKKWLSEKDSG